MFYDKDLMSSKSLGKVWRTGNGLNEEIDEDMSMARICEKLDSWVDNSNDEVHRRLSLRTSSIFIDGAARLYKRKLELLFEDVQKLDQDLSRRKKFRCSIDNDRSISQTFTDPEYQNTFNSNSTESNENSPESSPSDESSTNTEIVTATPEPTICQNTNDQNTNCDKGVQTSPKNRRNRRTEVDRLSCSDFDQNLPFGFVVIHDNYHSRIPSKIIFSSLCPDVPVKALTQEDVDSGQYTIFDIILQLPRYNIEYPPNMKQFYEDEMAKDDLKLDLRHKLHPSGCVCHNFLTDFITERSDILI